jgi:hypothetical protein
VVKVTTQQKGADKQHEIIAPRELIKNIKIN